MNLGDKRTLLIVAVSVLVAVMLLTPNWVTYILDVIQSVVVIVLGIVATIYLWKRL